MKSLINRRFRFKLLLWLVGSILLLVSGLYFLLNTESFSILVNIMIAFSIFIIILGIFISQKNKIKQDEAFFNFLSELSDESESRLIETFGELHRDKINILGNKLRSYKENLEQT